MRKIFTRANLIIFVLVIIGIGLAVFAIFQFVIINSKKQLLNELNTRSAELSQEITEAEETLEIVSSLEYLEYRARINGYAYPDEKRFVAKKSIVVKK